MKNATSPTPTDRHKSLVIITGASRGIGRAIALAVGDAVKGPIVRGDDGPPGVASVTLSAPLHMILIARSAESLAETAHLVKQRCNGGSGSITITVSCHEMDLSDLDTIPEKLQQILDPLSGVAYESCWLVNNAGSLGPLGLASSLGSGLDNMKALRKAVDFNVTSSIWLSSQFTKVFLPSVPLVRIVNISSLCAIEPFPTMSVYCAGKAGRDMYHSVLAKEHSTKSADNDNDNESAKESGSESTPAHKEKFKVLNYAPGACDTRMTDDLAECSVLDNGLHQFFTSSKEENKLIKPEDTAKKLVKILHSDEFQSGAHVDYWDV